MQKYINFYINFFPCNQTKLKLYALKYSCSKKSMDRGVWWATVHVSQKVGHN